MVNGEGVFNFLVKNNYLFFISADDFYSSFVVASGGNFIKAINNRSACSLSVGMRLTGIRSVVLVGEGLDDFIITNNGICKDYSLFMLGITNKPADIKTVSSIVLSDGYEKKLRRRIKEVDNNKNSLLLVMEHGNGQERSY